MIMYFRVYITYKQVSVLVQPAEAMGYSVEISGGSVAPAWGNVHNCYLEA